MRVVMGAEQGNGTDPCLDDNTDEISSRLRSRSSTANGVNYYYQASDPMRNEGAWSRRRSRFHGCVIIGWKHYGNAVCVLYSLRYGKG